jgi:hypothetical protein
MKGAVTIARRMGSRPPAPLRTVKPSPSATPPHWLPAPSSSALYAVPSSSIGAGAASCTRTARRDPSSVAARGSSVVAGVCGLRRACVGSSELRPWACRVHKRF